MTNNIDWKKYFGKLDGKSQGVTDKTIIRDLWLKKNIGTTGKNITSLTSAKKELFEEPGLKAKSWQKLGKFYIGPGHENIYANVFLATKINISKLNKSTPSGDELILKVIKLPVAKIKKLISSNRIECGITLAALNLYFSRKKK